MARIRTIKPEFWEDEKIGKLPIPCRLFFIGCWNFADDFGVIKGNAALLKSQIFPYDENLRVSEIKKWIDALVDARMLVPIIHAEESYYFINDWLKRNAPYCSNAKNFSSQITEAEFLKLKEKYTGKQIADIIEQIENRKDLRKRYTNLYRTVLNWAKKEYGN